ncbi:hypothetical protein [Actinoplanes sp. NPDC051494]|uniref:hypothetical protein n=1 Tax=Actinoplanes sp. NPDC051494 TaxID=3363907 RepID=UPI0037A8A365
MSRERDIEAGVAWYQRVLQAAGRAGLADLVVEPRTGPDGVRAGDDYISLRVSGRPALEAWVARLDSLDIAHSGIQRSNDPYVRSTIVLRDLNNTRLEVVAVDD